MGEGGIFLTAKIINYYACANSARGYVNYFEDNLKGLNKLYILKGGPGTGKSTLMKKIYNEWYSRGFDVEVIHEPLDNNSIAGVIIPVLETGVVDGTPPHIIEPKAPGAVEEYINLGAAWDSWKLAARKNAIIKLNDKIAQYYKKTYEYFEKGLKIHDEWEKIYLDNIDFEKLNQIADEAIEKIFGTRSAGRQGTAKKRFFGASTPDGSKDYVMGLTEDLAKRYFIKGRPGSGKSTMLKKIANTALEKGFDTEIYHCSFDPQSLDMVIIRELDTAIFDSTAPHEYFPSKASDEVIDIYSMAITPGTDEKYKPDLDAITVRYKETIKNGIECLSKAKELNDQLKDCYIDAMDFRIVDKITMELMTKLDDYFFSM